MQSDRFQCERCSPRSNGFALVIVLLVVALLAGLASSFVFHVSTNTRATTNSIAGIRARALADGGARLAALELHKFRRDPQGARLLPGQLFWCHVPKSKVVLRIATRDEAGRIDLNTSSRALLKMFFTGLTKDAVAAEPYVDSLFDFRDADDSKRRHGAEAAEYKAAGLTYQPKNGPLQSIEDLEQVLGMRGAMYQRAFEFVTVNSFLSGIEPTQADPALLEIVREGARMSGIGAIGNTGVIPTLIVSRSTRRTYRIFSTAVLPNGFRFTRDAVADLLEQRGQSVRFKRWMQGVITDEMAQPPQRRLPPC